MALVAFWTTLAIGSNVTLREAAEAHNIFIGACTNAGLLQSKSEPIYKQTEQRQFSLTTAENSCKVGPIHPHPDKYDFSGCDIVFDEAKSANQSVRGHNLCWHQQNPSWLNSSLSAAQLIAALEDHISTVVGRYGERAYAWDVVNEAVNDKGGGGVIKEQFPPWLPKVPDFIDRAFRDARKYVPASVKLFYNDYGAETLGAKSDRMYQLVKGMQDRGVPIDGVGFQTHIKLSFDSESDVEDSPRFITFTPDTIQSMSQNLKRFAALGLEVHITELDVRACDEHSKCDDKALQHQAKVYGDLLQMCLDIPKCKVFEMWGFTDRHTWTRSFQNPTGKDEMPLPFDLQYHPKPAYTRMIEVLTGTAPPSPAPSPPPTPGKYVTQTTTCKNAVAISGEDKVDSVAGCEHLCDQNAMCVGVDTDGSDCYLKSHCEGVAGHCSGWCSYVKQKY